MVLPFWRQYRCHLGFRNVQLACYVACRVALGLQKGDNALEFLVCLSDFFVFLFKFRVFFLNLRAFLFNLRAFLFNLCALFFKCRFLFLNFCILEHDGGVPVFYFGEDFIFHLHGSAHVRSGGKR